MAKNGSSFKINRKAVGSGEFSIGNDYIDSVRIMIVWFACRAFMIMIVVTVRVRSVRVRSVSVTVFVLIVTVIRAESNMEMGTIVIL